MPYINQDARVRLAKDGFAPSVAGAAQSPGALNYMLTTMCHYYIDKRGTSYAVLNEVMGVLACVQAELYRIRAAPYEDKKSIENGPV